MRYCTKCGAPVEEGMKFCRKCGAPLSTPAKNRPEAQPNKSKQAPPKKGRTKTVLMVISIVILAAAVIGLGAFLIWSNLKKDTVEEVSSLEPSKASVEEMSEPESSGSPTPSESASPVPVSDVTYYVTGTGSSLKLRAAPDGDSTVVAKLENGDRLKIMDDSDGQYWKVSVVGDDVTGYIDRNYITDEAGAVTEPKTYYVADVPSYLSVLDIPQATGYTELNRAYNGDTVTVLATPSGEFWYIYYAGTYGYVLDDYLSSTPPATPTPMPSSGKLLGAGAPPSNYLEIGYVNVASGYLALRNAKAFDTANEIGQLYNGDYVYVLENSGTYWYVYSPALGKYGYVNGSYLSRDGSAYSYASDYWTVKVDSGYLALRTAKAYDYTNEIGQLYTGDLVEVLDDSDKTYWYVYAPSLDKYGYVNRDYLR